MNNSPLPQSARLKELLPDLLSQTPNPQEATYLRCQLNPAQKALIPMASVRESLLLSIEQITPVPNMPAPFLGLTSSRDQVFGVVDLPHALGLSRGSQTRQVYQLIVVDTNPIPTTDENGLLGLAVPKIQGMSRLINTEYIPLSSDRAQDTHPAILGSVLVDQQSCWLIDPFQICALNSLSQTSQSLSD